MDFVINQLNKNKIVLSELLKNVDQDLIYWRQAQEKWCLLEIICHLHDEERQDFRFRTQWVLEKHGETPPPFNPLNWVKEHNYIEQDYETMVSRFISEREASIVWLKGLKKPNWDNAYEHSKFGSRTASYYLTNWLAHDYLHIRQILKLKFDYLNHETGMNLDYAGAW